MNSDLPRPNEHAYREARKERAARERGKSIPHYTRKVTREMLSRGHRGKVTPSKKGD
jgi:hypothetical protein